MKTIRVIAGMLLCALLHAQAPQNTPIYQTALADGMGASDVLLSITGNVYNAPTAQNPLMFLVGTEAMLVIGTQQGPTSPTQPIGTIQYSVKRAQLGTTAVVHDSGELLWSGFPSQFGTTDKGGSCNPPPQSPTFVNVSDSKIWTCVAGTWTASLAKQPNSFPFTFVPFAASPAATVDAGITRPAANTFDFGNGTPGDHTAAILAGSFAGSSFSGGSFSGTTLNTSGNATIGGTLNAGASTLASAGITGNATVGDTLNVTGASTTANINSSGNVTAIGLFGDLLTANSFTVGGAGVSTPSTISVIAPTVTGVTDLFRLSVNGCPTTAEYGAGTIPVLQGVVGCVKAPDNVVIGGVSAGLAGYSVGGGGTSPSPAVGVFATCNPGGVDNAGCWGANFAGTNVNLAGVGLPTSAWGLEVDCNVGATGIGGLPAANCWGVASVSSASTQPTGGYNSFDARITPGSAFPWKDAFTSEPGAATVGMTLWPILETASDSPSQPIHMISRSSIGDYQIGAFYLDSTGSYQFNVAAPNGNFLLNPAGVSNISSPELVFSSYSSGGTLQQGGMFLDAFGNLNINPSAATFSQTSFLNGAGETEAQINKHSFQMTPHTTDPGCSGASQVGSFWVSTAVPTVLQYCKKTGASTFAWSVITSTP